MKNSIQVLLMVLFFVMTNEMVKAQCTNCGATTILATNPDISTAYGNNSALLNPRGVITTFSLKKKTIEGSSYIDEEWKEAKIVTVDNEVVPANARYNIEKDEIEVQIGLEMFVLEKKAIHRVYIGKMAFIPLPMVDEKTDEITKPYYELLSEGQIPLLLHHKSYIQEGKASTGMTEEIPSKRRVRTIYYVLEEDGNIPVKLGRNKKSILNLFGSKASEVEKYAKKNKLKFKKKEELSKIFSYYNSLFEEVDK